MVTISVGIRLHVILRIFFVRMEAFSPALLSENSLSQSHPSMALPIRCLYWPKLTSSFCLRYNNLSRDWWEKSVQRPFINDWKQNNIVTICRVLQRLKGFYCFWKWTIFRRNQGVVFKPANTVVMCTSSSDSLEVKTN